MIFEFWWVGFGATPRRAAARCPHGPGEWSGTQSKSNEALRDGVRPQLIRKEWREVNYKINSIWRRWGNGGRRGQGV